MDVGPHYDVPPTLLPLNSLTPYLHAHVEARDHVLHWTTWWTALGFIPTSRRRLDMPLSRIVAVDSRVGIHWDRLAAGILLPTAAVASGRWWMVLPALAGGVLMLVMAPTARLSVRDREGQRHTLSLCILHKIDVDLVRTALADALGGVGPQQERP